MSERKKHVLLPFLAAKRDRGRRLVGDQAIQYSSIEGRNRESGVARFKGTVGIEDRDQERLGRLVIERGEVRPDLHTFVSQAVTRCAQLLEYNRTGRAIACVWPEPVDRRRSQTAGPEIDGRRWLRARAVVGVTRASTAAGVARVDLGRRHATVLERREQRRRPG